MSELILDNKLIDAPLVDILKQLRMESIYYLHDIDDKPKDFIRVTCPFHKNGQESKPACSVYARTDNNDITFGTFNCLACKQKGPLTKFVSQCLHVSEDESKEWLKLRFGKTLSENFIQLKFDEPVETQKQKFLDESILKQFEFYHPYMWKRKLTKEVVDKFHVGYNKNRDTITFPVWDKNHRLVMITERNVKTKNFYIPTDIKKPVYLLDAILKENHDTVYVVESQINALTLWSRGYPAVALFGTGDDYQYAILKKCNIHKYILCFDGDLAGRVGAQKFIHNIGSSNIYKNVQMPDKKDVNDLSAEEFETILNNTPLFLLTKLQ